MRQRLLGLGLAAVAGLLAVPLPAFADPITCPTTGAVCIDESVEGATPTITAPSGFQSSVVPVAGAVGEEWTVTITAPYTSTYIIAQIDAGLLEPNSQSLSDALIATDSVNTGSQVGWVYDLFSDNELGQIGTTCSDCVLFTEDGTFQQVPSVFETDLAGTVNLYLRSDVDAVPEPASLVLFGSALLGFGVIRRRRRIAAT